jgi:hypothetical protein
MKPSRAARRAAAALAAPLLLAGVLATAPAGAATAGCRSWTGAQPPSPGQDDFLEGVAVLSPCNAWAVGGTHQNGILQTLTEHWDGANWTVIPSPSPGSTNNFLNSVRAASPTNIWAVGAFSNGEGLNQNLILHWDGKAWTQQTAPSPGAGGQLNGVRAVSGSEAWAAGEYEQGNTETALLLHFTGGQWTQVKVKQFNADDELAGIAATSARDVWAVGTTGSNFLTARHGLARMPLPRAAAAQTEQTLILHWNGKTWTHVPSPSPGRLDELTAVGANSPSSAWAVGMGISSEGRQQTLTLHWNGKAWTRAASPTPGGTGTGDDLAGVTVSSPENAWAVGTTLSAAPPQPIILHWNGARWTTVATPATSGGAALFGVAASSDSDAWTVGTLVDPTSDQVLALHCC